MTHARGKLTVAGRLLLVQRMPNSAGTASMAAETQWCSAAATSGSGVSGQRVTLGCREGLEPPTFALKGRGERAGQGVDQRKGSTSDYR